MSLNFCTWYVAANTVPCFRINTSRIKAIKSVYNARIGSKTSRMRGMNEYLEAKKEVGIYEAVQELEHDAKTA